MKQLNHFHKAQIRLTLQYFLITVSIIVLANIIAIQVAHSVIFPLRHTGAGALAGTGDLLSTVHLNARHNVFQSRLLSFDIYLLLAAAAAAYFLSGRALRPIKHMMRLQEEFASDVSHELRTPLATIKMEIEAVRLSEKRLAPRYGELLNSIQEEVSHMTDTVSGLLALVRPDAADSNDRRPLDLSNIAMQAAEQIRAPATQKDISVITDELSQAPIAGNEIQLRQAVLALLNNAVRYTSNGGKIEVTTRATKKTSVISVADSGVGIKEQNQARIFDRFYREDNTQRIDHGGVGLGLAIARKIILNHGGSISVKSAAGKGSVFTVTLPRRFLDSS